jgi:hypothetical protein
MPISKDKMKLYPGGGIRSPEWLEIRARIRLRAHDLCEGCGLVNGAIGVRISGEFFPAASHLKPGEMSSFGKVIQIVCTVAHIDDDLVDHSDGNLAFWCQQCHNRHDAKGRAARRKGKFQ